MQMLVCDMTRIISVVRWFYLVLFLFYFPVTLQKALFEVDLLQTGISASLHT